MADPRYFTPQGVIVPDTAVILSEVQGEFQTALGGTLDVSPETPQGMLISIDTDARDSAVRLTAAVANQINPNQSRGVFLDALCALTGLERRKATRSRVILTLSGVPGTAVRAGVQVNVAGTAVAFATAAVAVIGPLGSVDVPALSVVPGPVEAAPGTLTAIATPVLGWEACTNAASPTPGRLRETDGALRQRRRETLGLQSVSLLLSLKAALLDLPDVSSCVVRENFENTPQTVDGVELKPHSVWACVAGGTDLEVAETLLSRKSVGAGWNGPTTVEVVEPASGKTYAVQFQRPTLVPVFLMVRVAPGSPIADPVAAVRAAVLAYANGEIEDEPGLGVSAWVSPFEIAAAINRFDPALFVREVRAGKAYPATLSESIPMEVFEMAQILEGNIQVVVG